MRAVRSLLIPALLGLVLLLIALMTRSGRFARDEPGRPINSAMRQALGQMTLPPADAAEIAARYPTAVSTPSGLRFIVTEQGEGTAPLKGEIVAVHYRGELLDGTLIDDSRAAGAGPYNFRFGHSQIMPAWDEALAGMAPGERRLLIIPYWLGFGEKGQRGKIPPKATLIYDLQRLPVRS